MIQKLECGQHSITPPARQIVFRLQLEGRREENFRENIRKTIEQPKRVLEWGVHKHFNA